MTPTVLCAATVQDISFAERLSIARAGGFAQVSLFPTDYEQARSEEKLGDADLRAMLADSGLEVAYIDPLLNWVPGLTSEFLGPTEEALFRMAEAVGARSVNLALPLPVPLPLEALVSAFAGVCDRAAERGLLVHVEFLPWTAIPSIDVASALVAQAGRANGGIMLDSWHHYRSGAPDDAINAVPGERILAVQLSDAPREAEEPDRIIETLERRRLPGDGDIDLVSIVRRLAEIGASAPIGVEIFSTELQRQAPLAIARAAGTRLRAVLAKAEDAHLRGAVSVEA